MGDLADICNQAVLDIGMKKLEQPVFYNAPIGIRFEIGFLKPKYIKKFFRRTLNPSYVDSAFERALTIYSNLPLAPNLLRIDFLSYENKEKKTIADICKCARLPLPHEQAIEMIPDEIEDNVYMRQVQLYWDLLKIDFSANKLLMEIIKGEFSAYPQFSQNTYFINSTDSILFHLYDDRGLDVVAKNKSSLESIYKNYNDWILDYDRERIDSLFVN
uniref:DUF3885 domain-containing protein n=1 Tax=Eubacterium sp. TaxID=142586 RepID=UPI0040259956